MGNIKVTIAPLTKITLPQSIDLVFDAGLDTREEIEHHLAHVDAHWVALKNNKIIGVIGWYQDTVNYANEAMGKLFPGIDAYWVGFFAVSKEYRGKGVGFALINHLISEVKKRSNQLWVSSVPESKKYYERQGFILVLQSKINDNDKYFLVKNLE